MDSREARRRLQAAQVLLIEPSTTREKFTSIRTLIEGINPSLDSVLARCDAELSTVSKIYEGEVIHLAAENLPENTEEEKKRKRYLLLFIKGWKDLKGEVARVEQQLGAEGGAQTGTDKASAWGKILHLATGPFGIITALAVVGVIAMKATSVDILIQNQGCGTMYPSNSIPISLPGLKILSDPIPSGGSAVATLPGLTVHVDGTARSSLALKVLTYSLTFQLPSNVDDVTMNGTSLMGKKTEIKLSDRDRHTLTLVCR